MGRKVSLGVAETPALTPLGSLRPGVRQVCHSLSGYRCSHWQNGVVVNGEGLLAQRAVGALLQAIVTTHERELSGAKAAEFS